MRPEELELLALAVLFLAAVGELAYVTWIDQRKGRE